MHKLRPFIILALLVAYLLASTGIVVQLHFCLGRVKAVSFALQEKNSCLCPSPEADSDCCRSEKQLIDTQSTHYLSQADIFAAVLVPLYELQTIAIRFEKEVTGTFASLSDRAPPECGIYLKNMTFRI